MRIHSGAMRSLLAVTLAAVVVASSGCFGLGTTHEDAVRDLISKVKYTQLRVEVDYAQGFAPSPGALSLLETRINQRLDKPGGVDIVQTAFTPDDEEYTNNDLRSQAKKRQDHRPGGDTAVLYILYLNGHHSDDTGNSKVLGVHFGYATIAIFKDTVRDSSGIPGLTFSSEEVEKAVLIHEFGHAVGLVNHGLEMVRDHEDPDHRGHSSNQRSVMYWAVENTLGLAAITQSIPNDFDQDDIADIRNAGGK